ncbi:MAG: hypothetical protein EA400_12825 [Chromatiaceae bacterium]|nr:MAG: hypothetical protein EA400_12825 [Chromatiaceae bacterium]
MSEAVSARRPSSTIEIRLGTEADRPQILARMEEVFGSTPARRVESQWDWRWQRDPRLPAPGYRGVVATWEGQVIANLATIPAGLQIGGAPAEAWWFVDVLVHWGLVRRALRATVAARRAGGGAAGPDLSQGLAMALFDHPAAGPIQLGKHVAAQLISIGSRRGFEPLGDTGSRRRRISTSYPLGRLLGRHLGAGLAALVDPMLGPHPRPRLPVQVHDGPFDARFDALWERLQAAYPAICRRDAALLDWRYRQPPDLDCTVLTLAGADGLRGYCVVNAFEQPASGRRRGRRRGRILDLLTAPEDAPARTALLAAALATLRRQRVERAECFFCGAELGRLLTTLGFVPKVDRQGQPSVLWARHLPAVARGLYATQGDGDGG